MNLPAELAHLLRKVPALSRAYLVGGCVRDALLGIAHKDFDLEVYGVDYETLERNALSVHGRVDLVGKSFGVIKFTGQGGGQWDFSLPRRDSKMSAGHKGFTIQFEPDIEPREAASRRDFTINALMFDPRTSEYLDFFGGREDLARRVLRFIPARLSRRIRCGCCEECNLPPGSIWSRRRKPSSYAVPSCTHSRNWPLNAVRAWNGSGGRRPVGGRRRDCIFLKTTGWLQHFPEVAALDGSAPQDPEWHPEGDVFTHTSHCCDALAALLSEWHTLADDTTRRVLMFAVLAHDFAKPQTTHQAERDGRTRIVSPGHEEQGGPLAEVFLTRINAPNEIKERVVPLVMHHMAHLQMISDRSVRRLANFLKPATISELCLVMTADHFGRPPKPQVIHNGVTVLRQKAEELQLRDSAPKPLLQGAI